LPEQPTQHPCIRLLLQLRLRADRLVSRPCTQRWRCRPLYIHVPTTTTAASILPDITVNWVGLATASHLHL
jgi:hypothetical protein